MDQNGLKDLLLTLAAQASGEYEKVLIDRNNKFEEIQLISQKMADLKEENKDSVFSPRSKLSAYDAILSLEKQEEREKQELNKLDAELDILLNKKEELLSGVELLDSILEEREELLSQIELLEKSELQKPDSNLSVSSENSVSENSDSSKDGDELQMDLSTATQNSNDFVPDNEVVECEPLPEVKQVLEVLSTIANQCGEIANYTIQDPYRARNELRAISVKWGN